MSENPLPVPAFRQALKLDPDAISELDDNTFWRYSTGRFPMAVRWLLKYPHLLRALANDAESVQKEQAA